MQKVQQDVGKVVKDVSERNIQEYFPNSYFIITASLATLGIAQIFAPDSLLNLLVRLLVSLLCPWLLKHCLLTKCVAKREKTGTKSTISSN
jgi:hypothetical protein